MKKRLGLRGTFLARLVAVAFIAYANVLPAPKHDNYMKRGASMENVYPVLYANTLQNSLINATVHAAGKEAWRKRRAEIEFGSEGHLLVSRLMVFLVASERITAFDATNKELWLHKKWTKSPVFLHNNVLYCQSYSKNDVLERVELKSGKPLKSDIGLPIIGDKVRFVFFEPQENGFLACGQFPGSQVLKDGKAVSYPPNYALFGEPYDVRDFLWIAEEMTAVILPILHISNKKQLCVGTSQSMVLYNSAPPIREPQPTGRFKYPLTIVKNICADSSGLLYLLGFNDKKEELVACDGKGTIKWKWNRTDITASVQPPAVGADGEIIVLSGSHVCGVKDGRLTWEFSTGLQDPNYVTTTSDGSVLIAARDVLFCCKEGKEVFIFDAGSSIIAPPVVDAEGSIYVLTPTEVIKVM
jgi:hypothetical protein